MLRMRRITDQGFVVLADFVRSGGHRRAASEIAERTRMPAATTAKVLKVLQRSGLLTSVRGLNGGYELACDPDSTSVLRVIEAFEGPLGITECSLAGPVDCDTHDTCSLGQSWPAVNDALVDALRSVSLRDLVERQTGSQASRPALAQTRAIQAG